MSTLPLTTLTTLNRQQLGEVFKDPRTLLAFERIQLQVAQIIPATFTAFQNLDFVVTSPDGTIPNAHVITEGANIDVATAPGTVTITATPSGASGTIQYNNAGAFAGGNLSGDVTTSGGLATTLATVNTNVGTFGDATHVGRFTVNAKGLVTAASSVAITGLAPVGGSTGQVLTKNSATDYDYSWQTPAAAGGTVTSVSSTTADLTVATPTTTPALTVVSAPKWTTARTLTLTGSVTGSASIDGSGNVSLTTSGGGGGTVSYDPVILAEASLTHYWPMNDAAGSTSLADAKGATALPVTDTISNLVVGAPGAINDGETCVFFNGLATKTNGIITIPAGVFPASGNYTFEFIYEWWGFYIGSIPISAIFNMSLSGSSGDFTIYLDGSRIGGIPHCMRATIAANNDVYTSQIAMPSFRTTHIAVTVSTTGPVATFYINGAPNRLTYTGTTPRQSANAGSFGDFQLTLDANSYPFQGKISKFAIYNTALSASAINAHYVATGLR